MSALPSIADFDDPNFDPFDDAGVFFGDMVSPYDNLREIWKRGGPVQEGQFRVLSGMPPDLTYPTDQRCFTVFEPEMMRDMLSDPATYSHDIFKTSIGRTFGNTLTNMNPPEHTQYRRIFQKAFLPHVVAEWSGEFIEPVVNELIGKFKKRGRAELFKEFVTPYPFEIIYRQLALPPKDTRTFHRLAAAQTFFQMDIETSMEASRKLGEYLQALIDQRRETPGTDLVSILATVEVDGEYLPDEVLLAFFRQLMNAAGDTTNRSTANMLVGLLRDRPDQYQMLLQDRTLISRAIEETLRWEGPVNVQMRTVMRDVELAGVKIPAGSIVDMVIAFVGRDPIRFPNPDQFDMMRPNVTRHVAFSHGPHVCLGQHLARLEMTRAMNAIMDNLPNLRLDPDFPPPKIQGYSLRHAKAIHVLFD